MSFRQIGNLRIMRVLEMVMPFFSQHVLVAHAPHEAALPEGDVRLPVDAAARIRS